MEHSTFANFELIAPVLKALEAVGYQHPTPIQALAIPPLIAGRDLLGSAQTGTGKTAAFAIPLLHRMGSQNRKSVPRAPRVLVLAPTRELAVQIAQSFSTYGKFLHLRYATVVGGVGQSPQVRALERGVHVLIATPGRLLDLMGQGHVRLDELESFVLDEVDRMLDMGFLPDLKRIVASLPEKRQSLFFSATMPPNIVQLAEQLLRDPVDVRIEEASITADAIDQSVYFVSRTDKTALLAQILQGEGVGQALVFTRTKHGAERLASALGRRRLKAAAIHGDKSQAARLRALSDFRAFKVDVLVATDVASRGIDVAGITHVVNFDIPHEPDSYVHRIGRTGRAGATGRAISLCDAGERRHWQAIEKMLGIRIRVDAPPAPAKPSTPSFPSPRRAEKPTRAIVAKSVSKSVSTSVPASVSTSVPVSRPTSLPKSSIAVTATSSTTGALQQAGAAQSAPSVGHKKRRPGRRERAAARAQAALASAT